MTPLLELCFRHVAHQDVPPHLLDDYYHCVHKQKFQGVMKIFKTIKPSLNTILKIQFIPSTDFLSYDHIVVKTNTGYSFHVFR